MRSLLVLPLLAALALGACKKESVVAKDESVESVAKKVEESGIKPRPGRWESNMTLDKMEMPGLPPQAKDAMNKQMGAAQTFASCLTPEQASAPGAGFFQKDANDCKYDRFVMADGRIDATMTCQRGGQPLKMTMAGSYSETNYDIKVTSEGEIQPGVPMSMAMSIVSRRVGECDGSEDKLPAQPTRP